MESDQILLAEDIYKKYLTIINNIRFTPREIDIISCIAHGKSVKGIAKFLSTEEKPVGERAIDTHILNIRRKIGGNSREAIVDFIEKSDKYQAIQSYYSSMFMQKELNRSLRQISAILKPASPSFLIVYWQENPLINKLHNYLKFAGVKILTEAWDDFTQYDFTTRHNQTKHHIIYVIPTDSKSHKEKLTAITSANTIFLVQEEIELDNINYINMAKAQKPYFLLFEILQKFFPDLGPIHDIIKDFIIKYKNIEKYPNVAQFEYTAESKELIITKPNFRIKINKFLADIYYPVVALLILTLIAGFIASRYFFQEDYYTQNTYEQVIEQINEFADKLTTDQILEQNTDILLLQKTIDDLYNKYPEGLTDSELQSKFNYLSCVLAAYYRYNHKATDEVLYNYLKLHYPYFKWFKNFNLKEFHDYVAAKILDKVLVHYNSKYGITSEDSIEIIKAKLEGQPYALEDYILLNYNLLYDYGGLIMKDWDNDYKFRVIEKHLSIAALGKLYSMADSYSAERKRLILKRNKIIKLISELERELKKLFPIIQNEVSLILIISKINSEHKNSKSLQKIIYDFLSINQSQEVKLKELIEAFVKLENDERKYIKHYKPWKKHRQEFLIPKNSFFYKFVLCEESLRTQAVLMKYYILLYYNDPGKFQQAQDECLSDSLKKLSRFLNQPDIGNQWENSMPEEQKTMLAKAVKYLANNYYNEKIASQLRIITDKLCAHKFDPELRNSIELMIKEIQCSDIDIVF